MQSINWRKHWPYAAGSATLAVAGFGLGQVAYSRFAPIPRPAAPVSASFAAAATTDPAPEPEVSDPEPSVEKIILAQRKRVMGRKRSLADVRRVATEVRPLVLKALESPAVRSDLAYLARQAGMSVADYKKYFAGKQAADLLLESGGDPNARSIADAIGVAQFLAGTGRGCGLRVDLGASEALTRQIWGVEAQIEALEAQPSTWSKAIPSWLRGMEPVVAAAPRRPKPALVQASAAPGTDASVAPASVAPASVAPASVAPAPEAAAEATGEAPPPRAAEPVPAPEAAPAPDGIWSRDEWIAFRKQQWRKLVAQRRRVDERYDPARAIMAQTRYLLKLTRRYGGVDWALQAYHGGEGGAAKTMGLFTGAGGTRTLLASRGVGEGRWLPYSEMYRHISPSGTPDAFGYLFGRSDDHRYYWWKVLMAERALDLYARSPEEFEKQWRELRPGYSADIAFYPEPQKHAFADNAELKSAYSSGELVRLPRAAVNLGVRTAGLAALEPEAAGLHKGLRPEAMGALLRVAHIYRSHGGAEGLAVTSMVQPETYRERWNALHPPPPLPPDVPRDPEVHTTGLVFDLRRPAGEWDRKVLEFALGRLYDTLRVSWRKENGGRVYHVVVNPEFREELAGVYRKMAK